MVDIGETEDDNRVTHNTIYFIFNQLYILCVEIE